jgi:hypothetical protein
MQKVLKIVGIAFMLLAVSGIVSGVLNNGEDNSTTNQESGVEENNLEEIKTEDISNVETSYQLQSGNYTAGIDLPVGKFNVTVISGDGNVSTTNMFEGGLNEMMGTSDPEIYTSSFSGVSMDKEVVLNISGTVIINIEYTEITGNYTGRNSDESIFVVFGNGNYTVGENLDPGIYNIVAISGDGNVCSSNMYDGGLCEMMGTSDELYYIKEFKNVILEESTTIKISNGVDVKLIQVN